MKLITATIPGLQDIFKCNPVNPQGCSNPISRTPGAPNLTNLADILSGLLNIAFYVAVFLTFFYLVWGAFQYLMAQGKKEELQKSTARITWALIGLVVVLMAYLVARFVGEIFTPKGGLPF